MRLRNSTFWATQQHMACFYILTTSKYFIEKRKERGKKIRIVTCLVVLNEYHFTVVTHFPIEPGSWNLMVFEWVGFYS